MKVTHRRSEILASGILVAILIASSIGIDAPSAFAAESQSAAVAAPAIKQTYRAPVTEPAERVRGEAVCYEIATVPARTICNYIPKYETASALQSRILLAIYDGRQPADPSEAYVRVVGNNQLEFMSIDPKMADLIVDYLSRIDILDTYISRQFVNMNLQVVELVKNSDANVGLLLSGHYAGKRGPEVKPQNRVAVENAGGIITSTFAIGNLINSVLNIALSNFKSRDEISIVSNVPFRVTHGFDLSNLAPVQQQVYRAFSIQTITEVTGIKFQGEARFHRDQPGKVLLKGFTASVSQVDEHDAPVPNGPTMGARTYRVGPLDLLVEPGCSTVIRVLNSTQNSKRSTRNWLTGMTDEKDESHRDFLIVVQAEAASGETANALSHGCDGDVTAQP